MIGTPSAKWTCDRCGLFEHVPTGGQPTKWVGVSVATPPSRDLDGVSRLHLCASCGALLIAWLEPLNTCAPEGESK